MKMKVIPYLGMILGLVTIAVISFFANDVFYLFDKSSDHGLITSFFVISIIFVLSFGIFHLSSKTMLPSFVVAIFFGIVAKPLLHPVVEEREMLSVLVGLGATLILFGGGLETPFVNFKKLFWKIASISFFGLFITAFLFSFSIYGLGKLFGIDIPMPAVVLLGAVLASTDPAAIIPVLKSLRFKNRSIKDLIVSESAVTDVTGTLLTVAFLGILLGGTKIVNIVQGYGTLFSAQSGILLLRQILFGIVFGVIGFLFLDALTRFKQNHEEEYEADAAFFLFVPIVIFTFALAFGGSGYLAAFIAGLLFTLTKHLHRSEHFFNHMIEGFFKPTIFILLGALVDIQSLIQYAGIGIVSALVFMFLIRPIAVFLTLGGFSFFGKERFRELLFVSFVRETGAIPAVLLVTVVSLGLSGVEGLLPIGMWVILLTLIIEPPLTPFIAKKLKVATLIADDKAITVQAGGEPFVILGSRGTSFLERLPRVVEWATRHNIFQVLLLHCLEDAYTSDRAEQIGKIAKGEFDKINNDRILTGEPRIEFSYVSRTGFLQKNIDDLSKEQENVTAIFVGRKVLDYRLEDVKNLKVPLFFID